MTWCNSFKLNLQNICLVHYFRYWPSNHLNYLDIFSHSQVKGPTSKLIRWKLNIPDFQVVLKYVKVGMYTIKFVITLMAQLGNNYQSHLVISKMTWWTYIRSGQGLNWAISEDSTTPKNVSNNIITHGSFWDIFWSGLTLPT